MATRTSRAEPRPPRAGALHELVEILELQRPIAVGIALAVAVVGFTVAVIAPGVLPPHPIVGASVGIAAVAIGIVAAVAADAGDRTVRGVRHVRPTGAAVAASGGQPLPQLTAWVTEQLEDADHVRIAIVAAGTDTSNAGPLAEALGRALAYRGNRVLVADLSVEHTDGPGVAEVGRGELRLSQAVEFAPGVDLARVRSGSSRVDALAALPRVTESVAGQVDVFIAALPGLRHPGALLGSTAAERSLLLAIEGVSSRVEVLAGIEALETARAPADLVILPPGVRLPAFEDEPPPAAPEGSGASVGGAAGSGGTDAPAVPEEAAPAVADDPPGHAPADDAADDVDRAGDAEDEAQDEPADPPGTAPRAPDADRLLEAEDERFEVPDAHDLAFLDGEDRLPPREHATEQQLRLLDDSGPDDGATERAASPAAGEAHSVHDDAVDDPDEDPHDDPDDDPTAAAGGGTTGRDAPTDLDDTAELEPVEVDPDPEPPAAPPAPAADPTAPPVDHAAEEPSPGTDQELQRIAAVVALARDVAPDADEERVTGDDPPGGAA